MKYAVTDLIDEMLAMKENLSVVSESNMQDMLDHLSDEEKDILLRLYVNESRKGNGMDIQKLDKYEQINLAIYLTKLFPKETEALTAVFEKKGGRKYMDWYQFILQNVQIKF